MADVSEVLWPFVLRAADLTFSDLCETPEYDAMCDAVHCPIAGGRLTLAIVPAFSLDDEGPREEAPRLNVAPPRDDRLLPRGVEWHAEALVYAFADVSAMFAALPQLLAPGCPPEQRAALQRCRDRIASTLLVLEAAEGLGEVRL